MDAHPTESRDAERLPELSQAARLREIAILFTRLGFTAFGGPAAHLAMMEDEVVHRRKWLDRQHFLDLAATLNFIPGPNSTELAIHLGLIRGGMAGLVLAGFCFITPAVLIILPLAWLYVRYAGAGVHPPAAVLGALQGVAGVVVAILAVTAWRFAGTVIRCPLSIVVGMLTLPADLVLRRYTTLQSEIVILAGAALIGILSARRSDAPGTLPAILPLEPGMLALFLTTLKAPRLSLAALLGATSVLAEFLRLGWYFLTVGGTLFGSGYVLVNYLETGLVEQLGWLTHRQVADAVAVGQVTPGPLLTTATFAGYLRGHSITGTELGGVCGALIATAAIFAPAFVLVAALGRVLPRIRRNRFARGALDAMNAAVVMLLAIVTVRFAVEAIFPASRFAAMPAVACAGSLILLLAARTSSTVLILCGAAAGYTWIVF